MVNSTKTATTSPVETTDYKRTESELNSTQLDNAKINNKKDVNISFGYNTTEYAKESTVYKDSINNSNSWVTTVVISLGFFIPVCVICILVIFYYKKGKTFYNLNALHCHVKYENRSIIK